MMANADVDVQGRRSSGRAGGQ